MRTDTAVLVALGVAVFAPPARATPDPNARCILPSVTQCRLLPDADGPHMVEQWCAGRGWIDVFAPCPSRFGPYS